ncbi:MAG: methyltransferase domain-containing protein, partial [Vicinamibacterales bacterium]
GRQFVAEARQLTMVDDESYDFVLSSHCLEHLADPLGGLEEWMRVLRSGGVLALVVPHKDATFDHRRPVTSLQHLLDDRERRTAEDDETHLDEVLRLTDLSLTPGVDDRASFEARSRRNVENRCVHHHVFDTRLMMEVLTEANLQVRAVQPMLPCHIVVIAEKVAQGARATNEVFIQPGAAALGMSPFPSDTKHR